MCNVVCVHALQVAGSGEFQLSMTSFRAAVDRQGQCCDLENVCQGRCRTFFRLCLTNFLADSSAVDRPPTSCEYGQRLTPVLGAAEFDVPTSDYNPLRVPFTFRWPVSIVSIDVVLTISWLFSRWED